MAEDTPTATETPAAVTPAPSWRDGLPDDLKAEKSLESFKDVGALAKSYVETKKMVGQKAFGVPGANATPEEVKAFHRAIGVPETHAEYKPKAHDMMAHPMWSMEAQADFLKAMHAAGATPSVVDAALQFYGNLIGGQVKSNTAMETEAKAELRQEWGVNYDTNLGLANRALSQIERHVGLDPGRLVEAVKGDDPSAIAKTFHWVAGLLSESGYLTGEPIRGVNSVEANARIQELQAQLSKVPEGSEQAKELINQIYQYGAATRAA